MGNNIKTFGAAPLEAAANRDRFQRLGIMLRRAWFSLNQAFRRRCAKLGLTPDQYTALRTLAEADRQGLTQKQLGEAMCSDPNTITSLLKRMEASGWIERRPHETDGRAHRVILLPAGRHKFRLVRQKAVALQQEVLGILADGERALFLDQLERVAKACQVKMDSGTDRNPRTARRRQINRRVPSVGPSSRSAGGCQAVPE